MCKVHFIIKKKFNFCIFCEDLENIYLNRFSRFSIIIIMECEDAITANDDNSFQYDKFYRTFLEKFNFFKGLTKNKTNLILNKIY